MGILTVICSNCKKTLGTKPTNSHKNGISHGLCPKCIEILYGKEIAKKVNQGGG